VIIEKLSNNKKLVNVINKLHSEPWPVFLSEDSSVKKILAKALSSISRISAVVQN